MKKQKVSLALRKQKISDLSEKKVNGGNYTTTNIQTIRVNECQFTTNLTNFTQCGQWTCEPNTLLTKQSLCCLVTRVYC